MSQMSLYRSRPDVLANALRAMGITESGDEMPEPDEASFPYHHNWALSRDGVARLLSSAHVVVDPSLFQGFGLVGIEGMASGAACLTAATSSG